MRGNADVHTRLSVSRPATHLLSTFAGVMGYAARSAGCASKYAVREENTTAATQHADRQPVVTLRYLGTAVSGTRHFGFMTDCACIYVFRPRHKPPHPVSDKLLLVSRSYSVVAGKSYAFAGCRTLLIKLDHSRSLSRADSTFQGRHHPKAPC